MEDKWNIESWFTEIAYWDIAWYYWNIVPKYWKTTGIDGTTWKDGNKPRGKSD